MTTKRIKISECVSEGTVSGDIAQPDGTILGKPYFSVDHETFLNGFGGKAKKKRWLSHLGDNADAARIRSFSARKNISFYIKSNQTGEITSGRS